ncbi:MAG: hypothetical protein J6Z36_03210 [Clostridia bacterium]|nr:hypothetical protein [Clostridia bacterium]
MNKTIKKFAVFAATALTALSVLASASGCWWDGGKDTFAENTFKSYNKSYSLKELKAVQASSFRALNEVAYPSAEREVLSVSQPFQQAVTDFAYTVYSAADTLRSGENFSFSPLGLYENLSVLSLASDNPTALAALNELLGMGSSSEREADFIKAYKTDFFANSYGTMQLYNGWFQTSKYGYNQTFVNDLTKHYAEAYQLNFQDDNDVKRMLDWVDAKIGEKNFLKKDDLEIDDASVFFLFTTLFFDNQWMHRITTSSYVTDDFYAKDGKVSATFMQHSYTGRVFDYGKYISCYDYYANGMKVKYIVPTGNESIYSLVDGINFLTDEAENELNPEEQVIVNLKVPRFEQTGEVMDFSDALQDCGLSYLFDENSCSFNYAFPDLGANESVHLKFVKQKNKVAFSEDGTTIKSVTMSAEMPTSVGPMEIITVDVNLNKPFIYVIYDSNDLPIYVGHLDKP